MNYKGTGTIGITLKGIVLFFILVLLADMLVYKVFISEKLNKMNSSIKIIEQYTGDLYKQSKEDEEEIIPDKQILTKHPFPANYLGVFRLTFYTPHELGASTADALHTATRTIPKEGRTIAVDPRLIPKGSLVYIEGWGYYIAEDTGSAIRGKRIDIFLNSYKMAKQLGNKQQARVYLLRKGA